MKYNIQTKGSRLTITPTEVVIEYGYWSERGTGKKPIPIEAISSIEIRENELVFFVDDQTYTVPFSTETKEEFAFAKQLVQRYCKCT